MINSPIFAIITAFTQTGQIDYPALKDFLGFLTQCRTRAIITNGTTAEFPSLNNNERMELLEFCRKNFAGQIINNISACTLSACKALLGHSQENADAVLLLPPFYYAEAGNEGIIHFFKAVLSSGNVRPVFLYNFPKHTGNPVTTEMIST